jgi:hypothetical protein
MGVWRYLRNIVIAHEVREKYDGAFPVERLRSWQLNRSRL